MDNTHLYLESIVRSIGVYNIKKNKKVRKVILNVEVNQLKKIVKPERGDKNTYYAYYELDESQLRLLSEFAEKKITPNFKVNDYVLQCEGVYNWDKKYRRLVSVTLTTTSCQALSLQKNKLARDTLFALAL